MALQQLLLCQIHIVLDDKRRELLNSFIFSSLFPLLGRENLKLAAQLKKSTYFSKPKRWSLQTQLLRAGEQSDKLPLFRFSESPSLHPAISQMSLFLPISIFFPHQL